MTQNHFKTHKLQINTPVDLFDHLTGCKGCTPHPFQLRVMESLQSGSNVILSAPTGSGKTYAALLPFLFSKIKNKLFADRCIYILPLRALAAMLFNETAFACKSIFGEKLVATNTCGKGRRYEGEAGKLYVTIQTGEQQNDPFFEGDIIFTTVDQLLSSYFMMPVSLPQRLGNINAGAMPGAFMVFDEFHLLESGRSMDTAIELMDRLSPFSKFLIMTATMSWNSIEWMADFLKAVSLQVSDEEIKSLPSYRQKARTYKWIPGPLTAEQIWQAHHKGRSIALVNTVTRAQDLFLDLKSLARNSQTRIILLHSRFYPHHRQQKEDLLSYYFGKNASESDVILVTTQVIEAGMDISADNLHTELAPMNNLIQRAGRCARYIGHRGIGTVSIYELELDDKGNFRWGPYYGAIDKGSIETSRTILMSLPESGKIVDHETERKWVNLVHANSELSFLNSFNLHDRRQMVHEAMEANLPGAIEKLIRDVAGLNIIITDSPETIRFDRQAWPRMLSVPRISLFALTGLFEEFAKEQWLAKIPVEMEQEDGEAFNWKWQTVEDIRQIINAPWLVVLHPIAASYSEDLGLRLAERTEPVEPVVYNQLPPISNFEIKYETFPEHASRIMSKCRDIMDYHCVNLKLIEDKYLKKGQLVKVILLTCALHDVGKLGKQWQSSMRAWQLYKDASKLSEEPLAHTDYDSDQDFHKQRSFPVRGPHAVEGAYAISQCLLDMGLKEDIAAAMLTAVARHHSSHAMNLTNFELVKNAENVLKLIMPSYFGGNLRLEDRPDLVTQKKFKKYLLNFQIEQDYEMWPLYSLLVRILRLSDQKASAID